MRSVLAAGALLLIGSAVADAQPFYGYGAPPPPPPGYGFRAPPPYGYGSHHRHCRIVFGYYGPRRICHWGW